MPHNAITWVELLQLRARLHPDELLYRYLHDGDVDGDKIEVSYGEFAARVRANAALLQARGGAGQRALLLYPAGIDFIEAFFACLYAGVVAVPAYPPDPSRLARTLPRLRGIVADAAPKFVLTTSFVAQFAELLMPQAPELATLDWVSTDETNIAGASDWREPEISPDTLAFLQYTSGSTGRPKGVMITHHNLLYNSRISSERLGLGRTEAGGHMVSWLPQYHDMGLIGSCINPLYNGYGATIMSPMAFLQKPARWVKALSAYKGTVSAAPNFAYDLVSRKVTDAELAALDLSHWRTAVNGAEPVRAEVHDRFLAKFGPVGFRATTYTPSYGMAESTLFISSKLPDEEVLTAPYDEEALRRGEAIGLAREAPGAIRLVSCGKAVAPQQIAIVDPVALTELPVLCVGEIWLRGQSDAVGYWRREEESRYTFGATLEGHGDGTWLRTGDLGFLDANGELFVTGRAKDLIIIRGRNHYPQDIEATVEAAHPAMRPACSAAFSITVRDEERLVIAAEADPRLLGPGAATLDELLGLVRAAVAEAHGVQPHAIALLESRSITKTTSGKIQRHAARLEYLDGSARVLARWEQAAPVSQSSAEEAPRRRSRDIEQWLVNTLAPLLSVRPAELDRRAPFTSLGLDSMAAVELVAELERWLGLPVPVNSIWDHPNIRALAEHFAAPEDEDSADATPPLAHDPAEPIAVVGMSCRFPGADSPEEFWSLLREGRDAVGAPPVGRRSRHPGAWLRGVEDFDPEFFGISPREARGMDPQQRLLLEVTWAALESAGICTARLARSDTGVFVGISGTDYALLTLADPEGGDAYSGTGNAHCIAANRLSYLLDCRGPSMAVDAACASSLVALDLACKALRSGEISRAIVGGVNLVLAPQLTRALDRAGMLAPDGRCKSFDAAADGYGRGEGCGVLILERQSVAQARGDRIIGLIHGSATNQDGRSNGLTAPNGVAQQRVIRAALDDAGLSPDAIGYVEAHGTGTPLGDPIEIAALREIMAPGRCLVGSVKSNLGHLEAAAGLAGLIKVLLCLRHGELAPSIHFHELNPAIALGTLEIAATLQPWPEGRLAGVSAFSFGGTNAHVIVGPGPAMPAAAPGRPSSILTLSAHTPAALTALATAMSSRLDSTPIEDLPDFCYTANAGRAPQRHRVILVGRDPAEMAGRLGKMASGARGLRLVEVPSTPPPVVFLFTGQGSQYLGMGRGLYDTEPVFRETLDRCDTLLRGALGGSLVALLYPDLAGGETTSPESAARLDQTAITQPAIFSVQVALAALWASWGVRPDAVAGHSVGAYAAAVVAGVLSLEDGIRLIAARGRLMGALPAGGAMAAVRASASDVAEALAGLPPGAEIAAINGPDETVISGPAGAVETARAALEARGFRAVPLSVSHAFHSALMEPMLGEFVEVVSKLRFHPPRIRWASDHTGRWMDESRVSDPIYWREHLRRPVRFTDVFTTLGELEPGLLIEVGPNPILIGMGRRSLPGKGATWAPSLRKGRDDVEIMMAALAEVAATGVEIDWEGVEGTRARRRLELPITPMQRRRLWIETAAEVASGTAQVLSTLWRPEPAPDIADLRGDWVVLGEGAALAAAITAAGGSVVPEIGPETRGVYDTRPLSDDEDCPAEERISRTLVTMRALSASKAHLVLVTRGGVSVGGESVDPAAAALWGLGRAFAVEHPQRWGGLVDLGGGLDQAAATALLSCGAHEQIALRAGVRHVARLVETAVLVSPPVIDGEGWFLITGGTGGLGRQVAAWLIGRGAKKIALTSRSGGQIGDLAKDGVEIRVFSADVADERAMAGVLAELPGLRGVVHAAGVVERLAIEELDEEALDRALSAKVAGSRVLDALCADLELDFFWCFSSVAALWGGQGLMAYAAANAYQDGLAARRVAADRPSLSLQWSVWADAGMASADEQAALARLGLRPLKAEAALERLALLGGRRGVLAVVDADWSRLRTVLEARAAMPLLAELGNVATAPVAGGGPLLAALLASAPGARRGLLIEALRALLRAVAQMPADAAIPLDRGFFDMGIDSLMAVDLVMQLGRELGRALPSTLLLDQPDLGRLADWLLATLGTDLDGAPAAASAAVARTDTGRDAIAIIGMACRFPGQADSPEALWALLAAGRDAVGPVPADRWDVETWVDPTGERPGSIITGQGGYIDGIDQFDAAFFGIIPREAARMDPQHRLLLEVAWTALEAAGAAPVPGAARRGGVFVGIGSADYLHRVVGARSAADIDAWTGTGNATAFSAGRLAFHLGLEGPALAVDTACSSSLVAAHLAASSLRAGECDLALAAGVSVMIDPTASVYLSRARALAPDGRCKSFDAAADGYGRGEGCGVVVLKRLADALADGDHIHAVLRGSAVNHDGRSSGITVPNGPAQQRVIRRALTDAGLSAEEVGYVEAHGTGTGLGDPIEVGALDAVLGRSRPLVVGTVKTNLGHLEAAAGIAGLIKTALCVEKAQIPPNLHFYTRNPHIDPAIPLSVPTALQGWPRPGTPVAGVSAFGLSGTNAHVLLSGPPLQEPAARAEHPAWILPLSAATPAALLALASAMAARIEGDPTLQVADLCASALGRGRLAVRVAVVGADAAELARGLRALSADDLAARASPEAVDVSGAEKPETFKNWRAYLEALAARWRAGLDVEFAPLSAGGRRISLPGTVFQRRRHWLEPSVAAPATPAAPPSAATADPGANPFLGARVRLPLVGGALFATHQSPTSPAWLGDHRLFGRVVTPGAAHIALALEAARVARGLSSVALSEISFSRALILDEGEDREVQILLDADQGEAGFKIGSVKADDTLIHATGRLLAEAAPAPTIESLVQIQARLSADASAEDFYARFDRVGYTLGPAFRWMGETWRRDGEALCRLVAPNGVSGLDQAPLHPGLIDSCFQLLTRCLPAERVAEVLDGSALFVPVAVERFTCFAAANSNTATELYAHAVLREAQIADILLRDGQGKLLARIEGLRVARVPRVALGGGRVLPDDVYELRWRAAALEDELVGLVPARWLVLADQGGTGASLAAALSAAGQPVSVARRGAAFQEDRGAFVVNPASPAQLGQLLARTPGTGRLGVVSLLGLDDGLSASTLVNEALNLTRALGKERLFLITRGAVGVEGGEAALAQSALLGLQRTVALEKAALECTSVDLDPALPADAVAELAEELTRGAAADQVRLRLSGRSVARLVEKKSAAPLGSVRYVVGDPGALESVAPRPASRTAPGPGQVEIQVRATGLNFRDVLGALGAYPGDPGPLGGEAAGLVSAIGAGVTGLAVGDRVVTLLASSGCYRSYATADARFVAKLPDTVSFLRGATVPVAFATVLHGLEALAGLRRGDRLLIHAATGGVGLAAVQLATAAGAEIFATAGSPAKRRALVELGCKAVYSSRDLAYVPAISALGGVDVVLNSLGVEHVAGSLSLLRDGGRFIEIGKADVLDAARVAALGRGITYHHFDLVTMSEQTPERIAALLAEIMGRLADGRLAPLPYRDFSLDETLAAFRHMARARHVGKVVVSWPEPPAQAPIRSDRGYLVTGGLGALGLKVGAWLVAQGAGSVVLLGRRAPGPAVAAELSALGPALTLRLADVGDEAALKTALTGLPLPLGGIFHCAGVLDDALIADQDAARVARVLAPKVAGGWNLHRLSADAPLEHFVCFSSASGLLGSPGQASYSAANSWLDGLASLRRACGLPGLSVAWGPWDSGMAEGSAGKGRWSRVGIAPIAPDRGLEILGALLGESANAAVLPMDRARMVRGLSLGPVPPLMLELLAAETGGNPRDEARRAVLADLRDCDDPEERRELMIDYLCCALGTVTEQDEVDPNAPLSDNDSLVGVEFSALVESELGVTLRADAMSKCQDLVDLAELLMS